MKKTRNTTTSFSKQALGALLSGVLVTGMIPALALADKLPVELGAQAVGYLSEDGTLAQGADDVLDAEGNLMQPYALTEYTEGFYVFDWFDKFENGYYTDTDAKKVIDVSAWNKTIDWKAVKDAGVDYAIIKCGSGFDDVTYMDTQWLNNVKGCQQNSIPFGVYYYSYADSTAKAAREAEHALSLLKAANLSPSNLSLPVYYDMESDVKSGANPETNETLSRAFTDYAKIFNSRLASAGYRVGVYSGLYRWESLMTDPVFDTWYKWMAAYNSTIGLTFEDFKDFRNSNGIWQFSSKGKVPGISTSVDLNYTYMATTGSVDNASGVAMQRLYNPNSGEHFYTASIDELNFLTAAGWHHEGVGWYAPTNGNDVYRLYNPNAGDHHYTTSSGERDALVAAGWKYEGIGWKSGGSVPLHRGYNPNAKAGAHNYTTSKGEHDMLVSVGWHDEGIAWYGTKAGA